MSLFRSRSVDRRGQFCLIDNRLGNIVGLDDTIVRLAVSFGFLDDIHLSRFVDRLIRDNRRDILLLLNAGFLGQKFSIVRLIPGQENEYDQNQCQDRDNNRKKQWSWHRSGSRRFRHR